MKTINNKTHYLLVCVCLLFVGTATAQSQQTHIYPIFKNKGLFQRLIEIKYSSELYLGNQLKNESQKDTALAIYNTLRWKVDGFVYQLSSELIAANSPREWRKLNEWCLDGKTETGQKENVEEIERFYTMYIEPTITTEYKNISLVANVNYLVRDSYSIIKGLSDLKTQKTMALVELLDHTRLLSPGDVVKLGVK